MKRGKGREGMLGLAEGSIVLTHLKPHQRRFDSFRCIQEEVIS